MISSIRNPRSVNPAKVHDVSITVAKLEHRMRTPGYIFESDIEHSIVQSSAHEKLEREVYVFESEPLRLARRSALTVHALLVGKRLTLLRSIPFNDQTISKSQSSSRVRSPNRWLVSKKRGAYLEDSWTLTARRS